MEKLVCIIILAITLLIGKIASKHYPMIKRNYTYYVYTHIAIALITILIFAIVLNVVT